MGSRSHVMTIRQMVLTGLRPPQPGADRPDRAARHAGRGCIVAYARIAVHGSSPPRRDCQRCIGKVPRPGQKLGLQVCEGRVSSKIGGQRMAKRTSDARSNGGCGFVRVDSLPRGRERPMSAKPCNALHARSTAYAKPAVRPRYRDRPAVHTCTHHVVSREMLKYDAQELPRHRRKQTARAIGPAQRTTTDICALQRPSAPTTPRCDRSRDCPVAALRAPSDWRACSCVCRVLECGLTPCWRP